MHLKLWRSPFVFMICFGVWTVFHLTKLNFETKSAAPSEQVETPLWFEREFSSCSPVRNIALLKVHKAASSSIQNVLFRFGLKNELHFALPKSKNYFGHGVHFRQYMIPKSLVGNFEINIFAIHTKWDFEAVKSVMPNDTVFIASVREPISLFESMYDYMNLGKKNEQHNYVKYRSSHQRKQGIFGLNQMTFDFGLQTKYLNDLEKVAELVEEADRHFDLVLVADLLDQSLILLRYLLCWTHDDIVSFKINARKETLKSDLSEVTRSLLKERLSSDYLLYNHFSEKLKRFLDLFGKEKMDRELKKLTEAREKLVSECSLSKAEPQDLKKGYNKPFSKKVSAFVGNKENENCRAFLMNEISLIDYIRRIQRRKVQDTSNSDSNLIKF